MIKKYLRVMIILFFSFLLSACAGIGDADYKILDGYVISVFNGYDIRLQSLLLDRSDSDSKANDFIKEYKYNNNYIFIKSIRSYIVDEYYQSYNYNTAEEFINSIPNSDIDYFVIDVNKNVIYGSFSENDFYTYIEQINQDDMTEWDLTTDGINLPVNKN